MKNITDTPKDFNIEEIFNDIKNTKDYTTSLEISEFNLNIIFNVNELKDAITRYTDVCLVNRELLPSTTENYNKFYKYYTLSTDKPECVPFLKNDYPENNWFPANHSNIVGPDGTIVFRDTMPIITDATVNLFEFTAIGNYNQSYYKEDEATWFPTLDYSLKTDGYKIINNAITINSLKELTNGSYQSNRYGQEYIERGPILEVGAYSTVEFRPADDFIKNVKFQEKEGVYFWYKHFDTLQILKDHKLLEYEIEYIFNEPRQINTLQGFIFNLKNTGKIKESYAYAYNWQETRQWFGTTNTLEINPLSINEANEVVAEEKNYSIVYLYVFGFDNEINEQVPMGYRSLKGPDFVDLEQMVPLIPKKITKIKLKVQQKVAYTTTEIPNEITITDNLLNELKGSRYYVYGKSGYGRGYDGIWANLGDVQFDRFCGITKFVPGFNKTLTTNNRLQYHTHFDTRNFTKFKSNEGMVLANTAFTGREMFKTRDYYPYIYDIELDSTNLSFNINNYCYKHNDILSDAALDSVDVEFIVYDYNDLTSLHDATIISTINISAITNRQTVNINDVINNSNAFINFKLNFNQSDENLIDTLTLANTYTFEVNNYEYDFKLPIVNNIKTLARASLYKYQADSTNSILVIKSDTNYILFNKNINTIYIDTTIGGNCAIQIVQIDGDNLLSEHWLDGTSIVAAYEDATAFSVLNAGRTTFDISALNRSQNTDFLGLYITYTDKEFNTDYRYSDELFATISYNIPYQLLTYWNVSNIPNFLSTINDNSVFYYKLTYTNKV